MFGEEGVSEVIHFLQVIVVVGDDLSNLADIKSVKMRGKSKRKMKSILGEL